MSKVQGRHGSGAPAEKSRSAAAGFIDNSVAANIDNLSQGSQEAFIACVNAIKIGGHWGFIKAKDKDLLSRATALAVESSIRAEIMSNGLLVQAPFEYLLQTVQVLVPGVDMTQFRAEAAKRLPEAQAAFVNYLKHLVSNGRPSRVTIGLYSVNDSNRVVIQGNTFKAFKLTLEEATAIIDGFGLSTRVVFGDGVVRNNNLFKQFHIVDVETAALVEVNFLG